MKSLIWLVVLCLNCLGFNCIGGDVASCPEMYTNHNGFCFYLSNLTTQSSTYASTYCAANNGVLPGFINSAERISYVEYIIWSGYNESFPVWVYLDSKPNDFHTELKSHGSRSEKLSVGTIGTDCALLGRTGVIQKVPCEGSAAPHSPNVCVWRASEFSLEIVPGSRLKRDINPITGAYQSPSAGIVGVLKLGLPIVGGILLVVVAICVKCRRMCQRRKTKPSAPGETEPQQAAVKQPPTSPVYAYM